jgi:hypothetical protein
MFTDIVRKSPDETAKSGAKLRFVVEDGNTYGWSGKTRHTCDFRTRAELLTQTFCAVLCVSVVPLPVLFASLSNLPRLHAVHVIGVTERIQKNFSAKPKIGNSYKVLSFNSRPSP